MAADFVWVTGGDQAKTFHDIPDRSRVTVCGRYCGEQIVDGRPKPTGRILTRADAAASGFKECRSCFGHAQRRKPIIEGRRNDA